MAENRKARHDYNIEDTIEAGIALQGTEIKSIRRGSANLKDSYAHEAWRNVYNNMHIAHTKKEIVLITIHYVSRKLLLHKKRLSNSANVQEKLDIRLFL